MVENTCTKHSYHVEYENDLKIDVPADFELVERKCSIWLYKTNNYMGTGQTAYMRFRVTTRVDEHGAKMSIKDLFGSDGGEYVAMLIEPENTTDKPTSNI